MLCRNSLIRGNHWEIIQLLSLCFNKPYSKFDMPTARLAAAGGQRPPLQFQLSEFPHSFARLPPRSPLTLAALPCMSLDPLAPFIRSAPASLSATLASLPCMSLDPLPPFR